MDGEGWEYHAWDDVTEESDMKAYMKWGLSEADGEIVAPDE